MAKLSKFPFVIAIDGPAASGKGTIGRRLAEELGLSFLDTGSLYREVAHRASILHLDASDEVQMEKIAQKVRPGLLDSIAIRSSGIAKLSPSIAAMPRVRKALLGIQREFARTGRGAVLDGRDIGTVVCPDADVKLFVTATPEIRALRRMKELEKRGEKISELEVLRDIRARDERDTKRATAPLFPAKDAVVIDTSLLTIDEAVQKAISVVLLHL